MNLKQRALVAVVAAAALTATTTAGVLAHDCKNASKAPGAGSAGTVVINVDTGEFDVSGAKFNEHSGRAQGGFATVQLIDEDGVLVGESEVFAQRSLPEQARSGDRGGDGKGIDNAFPSP